MKLANRNYAIKFFIAGLLSTCAQYALFLLLASVFDVEMLLATTGGYLFGSIANYMINYYFTFNSTVAHYESLISFYVMVIFGALCNALIMYLMVNFFSLNLWAAQIISTTIIFGFNFFISKRFIFKRR